MNYRNLRVAELIKKELGGILVRELDLPEGVLVTIVEVKTEKDLSQAKVKLGIIPYEKSLEVFQYLQKNLKKLQFMLVRKIEIKPMPTLKFEISEEKT